MKPILFNTEMVRAVLDGRKTVTRRVIKQSTNKTFDPFWECYTDDNGKVVLLKAPYSPGDILYVREKFACDGFNGYEFTYVYWTDVDDCGRVVWGDDEKGEWAPSSDYRWRPSIHMPKEAARIFLRVTNVHAERLKEIGNCIKEGIAPATHATAHMNEIDERWAFAHLWDSTIKPADLLLYGWEANPWVWVIEFERCEKPKEEQ